MEQQRAEQACEALQQRINADEREERDLAIELRTLGQRGLAAETWPILFPLTTATKYRTTAVEAPLIITLEKPIPTGYEWKRP